MTDKEKQATSAEEKLKRLKARATELEGLLTRKDRELADKETRISKLEQAITERDAQIDKLKQSLAEAEEQQKQMDYSLARAVTSYKAMVTDAHPQLPAELICGETIEAINESLAKAKTLVSKVRQGLEAEMMSTRMPSGAPARTAPDLSALSPREKIQYAIGGNK